LEGASLDDLHRARFEEGFACWKAEHLASRTTRLFSREKFDTLVACVRANPREDPSLTSRMIKKYGKNVWYNSRKRFVVLRAPRVGPDHALGDDGDDEEDIIVSRD